MLPQKEILIEKAKTGRLGHAVIRMGEKRLPALPCGRDMDGVDENRHRHGNMRQDLTEKDMDMRTSLDTM